MHQKVQNDIRIGTPTQKGDWRPLLFLFTDGKPSDPMLYNEMIPKIKALNFGCIVGCAAGPKADNDSLKKIREFYMNGHATKDDYAKALRLCQKYVDGIKSAQRDKAGAYKSRHRYY